MKQLFILPILIALIQGCATPSNRGSTTKTTVEKQSSLEKDAQPVLIWCYQQYTTNPKLASIRDQLLGDPDPFLLMPNKNPTVLQLSSNKKPSETQKEAILALSAIESKCADNYIELYNKYETSSEVANVLKGAAIANKKLLASLYGSKISFGDYLSESEKIRMNTQSAIQRIENEQKKLRIQQLMDLERNDALRDMNTNIILYGR